MRVEPVKNFDSSDARSFGFKVTYNASGGKAFIHSESSGIPNDEGEMLLSIAKGVRSVLGRPGTDEALERTVNIPGIESYFRIESVNANEVANDRDEMERIGTITASAPMRQSQSRQEHLGISSAQGQARHWRRKAGQGLQLVRPPRGSTRVMKLATPVSVEWIPAEREFFATQSFKFTADTGRFPPRDRASRPEVVRRLSPRQGLLAGYRG